MRPGKRGGTAAILTGILVLASAAFEVLAPLAENAVLSRGIVGLAAVPAITRMVEQDEWMTWLNNLALLGFALIVADNFRQIRLDHQIAHAYMESADPSVKAAIEISWWASH